MGKIGNAKTAAAIRASRHTRGLKAYDNVEELVKDLDDYAFGVFKDFPDLFNRAGLFEFYVY